MKNYKAIDSMKSLDIFINSLNDVDYTVLKKELKSSKENTINLLSLDIHLQSFNSILQNASIKKDLSNLSLFAKKLKWKNNLDNILNKNPFEAIILTDINRTILWVNDGFSTMTGFSKKEAINNKPSFLQGRTTSSETKERIRKKLQLNQNFKEVIINHRKDNTTYKCELHIFPLLSATTTHFLALERRIA